jgi:uncharacterized protein (DUF2235 family)
MTRRLIVCSDGTWNTPERKDKGVFAPSNVVKMARSILPQAPDGTPQIVFYDPGVGTDNVLDKFSGGAFGIGLSKNVKEAYRFLVQNHADRDEIYFFGFSRGAYTVRSTAGLIRNCGLLHKRHADLIPKAFEIYRKRDQGADGEEATRFREKYSRRPLRLPIKFIGVWDTVGALGIPIDFFRRLSKRRYEFHNVSLSGSVSYAYQALAIDEKRGFFKPALWEKKPEATDQVLEQAWFAGVHMDVGGGYNECGLSNAAFHWMKQKAEATGLAFDEQYVEAQRSDYLAKPHESRNFPYNLFRPYSRPIGEAARSGELVDPSARERYEKIPSYRPKNLVSYLRRHRAA